MVFLTSISSVMHQAASFVNLWEGTKDANAFKLDNVLLMDTLAELDRATSSPRVIVCSNIDMSKRSSSRAAFLKLIAHNPLSCVILTQASYLENSLGTQLATLDQERTRAIAIENEQLVDLEGEELLAWQEEERIRLEDLRKEQRAEEEILMFEEAQRRDADEGLQHKMIERQLSMDDNEGGVLLQHMMFPHAAAKEDFNVYGEVFDFSVFEGEGEKRAIRVKGEDARRADKRVEEKVLYPQKLVNVQVQVTVNCAIKKVVFFPFGLWVFVCLFVWVD